MNATPDATAPVPAPPATEPDPRARPIGVFDSGIGGLSVLRALLAELPRERFVYLADTAHAPYGERGDAFVRERAQAITELLVREHRIKTLVVACNTATAAAVDGLRARHPELPVVGVEPALKPAAELTRTGRVGVMATQGTLSSTRFSDLLAGLADQAEFVLQACPGLAEAVEKSARPGQAGAAGREHVRALCARHLQAMGPFGRDRGAMDTLVLGCTHYVFAAPVLQELVGPSVRLVETGEAVARRTRDLLRQHGLLADGKPREQLLLLASGDARALYQAAGHWLTGHAGAQAAAGTPAPWGASNG